MGLFSPQKNSPYIRRITRDNTRELGKSQVFEVRAGIEPAHRGFADPSVSTSPSHRVQ